MNLGTEPPPRAVTRTMAPRAAAAAALTGPAAAEDTLTSPLAAAAAIELGSGVDGSVGSTEVETIGVGTALPLVDSGEDGGVIMVWPSGDDVVDSEDGAAVTSFSPKGSAPRRTTAC